jgi:tryptophan synthase alpha chain
VAVGFGIRTPEAAAAIARIADAAVVGSAIVEEIRHSLHADGRPTVATVESPLALVRRLAEGVRGTR